jgi:hypothetical protein
MVRAEEGPVVKFFSGLCDAEERLVGRTLLGLCEHSKIHASIMHAEVLA